jgi:hypothetical protein
MGSMKLLRTTFPPGLFRVTLVITFLGFMAGESLSQPSTVRAVTLSAGAGSVNAGARKPLSPEEK